MPRLSVIMPVYNTVDLLEGSVSSVLAQTMSDLELILVDDGATDGSGALCDALAEKDSRIRVVHKKNGGVASARNAGLDVATGDYVGWVDSDDRVSPVMYQILLEAADTYGADIVQCEHKRDWEMLVLDMPEQLPEPLVLDSIESLKQIHQGRYSNYMALWSKIYKRELFEGLRFTEGQAFEDDERTPKLLYRGKRNVFFEIPLYQYMYRDNSIAIAGKPQDVITLAGHLEDRMHWFKTLDEALYMAGKRYLYWFLTSRLCMEQNWNTPVQDKMAELLIKNRKRFWPDVSRYDRMTLLILSCGNGAVRWVAKHDFAPIQNILAKIKALVGK